MLNTNLQPTLAKLHIPPFHFLRRGFCDLSDDVVDGEGDGGEDEEGQEEEEEGEEGVGLGHEACEVEVGGWASGRR